MTQATKGKRRRRVYQHDTIMRRLAKREQGLILPGGETVWQMAQEGADSPETNGSEASATFVIVTRGVEPNRHGNKVQIVGDERGGGLVPDHFQRNPVVLVEHGLNPHFPFPIGTARNSRGKVELTLQKTKAVSTVYFDQASQSAMDVFRMVDAKILGMASIGFKPTKATLINRKQSRLPEGVRDLREYMGGLDFVESDLWEWSVVAIGADPGALRQTLDKRKVGGERIGQSALNWLRSLGAEYQRSMFPGWVPLGAEEPEPTPADSLLQKYGVTVRGGRSSEFLSALNELIDADEVDDDAAPGDGVEQSSAAAEPGESTSEEEAGGEEEVVETGIDPRVENQTITPASSEPVLTGEQLAAAYAEQQRSAAMDTFAAALPELMGAVIAEAVKPLREEQQRIRAEVERQTGRVS